MYCTDTPESINNKVENEPFVFQPARNETSGNMNVQTPAAMSTGTVNTAPLEMQQNMPQGNLGGSMPTISAPGGGQRGFLSNASRQTVDNLFGTNDNIPETVTNPLFWPAYLRKFIGQWVRVDFFIGNSLEERIGQLIEVGASYIVLNVLEPETVLICDIFSIKFVTVVFNAEIYKLY